MAPVYDARAHACERTRLGGCAKVFEQVVFGCLWKCGSSEGKEAKNYVDRQSTSGINAVREFCTEQRTSFAENTSTPGAETWIQLP